MLAVSVDIGFNYAIQAFNIVLITSCNVICICQWLAIILGSIEIDYEANRCGITPNVYCTDGQPMPCIYVKPFWKVQNVVGWRYPFGINIACANENVRDIAIFCTVAGDCELVVDHVKITECIIGRNGELHHRVKVDAIGSDGLCGSTSLVKGGTIPIADRIYSPVQRRSSLNRKIIPLLRVVLIDCGYFGIYELFVIGNGKPIS